MKWIFQYLIGIFEYTDYNNKDDDEYGLVDGEDDKKDDEDGGGVNGEDDKVDGEELWI